MSPAAYAIVLERSIALDEGSPFVESIARLFLGERETAAELAAKCRRLIIGAAEPLRQAPTEEEFRASFALLDGRAFFVGFSCIMCSPAFPEAQRAVRVAELSRQPPQARNQRALELRDDLLERSAQLTPVPRPLPAMAALAAEAESLASDAPELAASVGRFLACATGLTYAAFGRELWEPWQLGLLWTFGERSLMDQAKVLGIPPDEVIARTTTRRDRDLMAQPVDRAASDEALALLGLDS